MTFALFVRASLRNTGLVFVFAVLSAAPVLAQRLGGGNVDGGLSPWRVIATLVFLALICAVAWFVVRKKGGTLPLWQGSDNRRIQIVEITRVAPQSSLCLARYDGKDILLAFTAQGVTVIDTKIATAATEAA